MQRLSSQRRLCCAVVDGGGGGNRRACAQNAAAVGRRDCHHRHPLALLPTPIKSGQSPLPHAPEAGPTYLGLEPRHALQGVGEVVAIAQGVARARSSGRRGQDSREEPPSHCFKGYSIDRERGASGLRKEGGVSAQLQTRSTSFLDLFSAPSSPQAPAYRRTRVICFDATIAGGGQRAQMAVQRRQQALMGALQWSHRGRGSYTTQIAAQRSQTIAETKPMNAA